MQQADPSKSLLALGNSGDLGQVLGKHTNDDTHSDDRSGIIRPEFSPGLQIISTSSEDLSSLVEANSFRIDLYYRLSVYTLRHFDCNVSKSAAALGLKRQSLQYRLRKEKG